MRPSNKLLAVISLALLVVVLVRCSGGAGNQAKGSVNVEDISKGQAAAAQYCQSCHQLPDPSLLDKVTWRNHVLPVMGRYMGIKSEAERGQMDELESDASYMPNTAQIDSASWAQINAYFVAKAPEHLPAPKIAEPIHKLAIFEIQPTPTKWDSARAMTSYVKIDVSVKPHRLIVADGLNNRVITLNDKGKTLSSSILDGAVVICCFSKIRSPLLLLVKICGPITLKMDLLKKLKLLLMVR